MDGLSRMNIAHLRCVCCLLNKTEIYILYGDHYRRKKIIIEMAGILFYDRPLSNFHFELTFGAGVVPFVQFLMVDY